MKTHDQLGGYEILSELGEGPSTRLFLARRATTGSPVALKILAPEIVADSEVVRALHREVARSTALDHPNVGRVFDVGRGDDGRHYVAVEYLEGAPLTTLLEQGPLEPLHAVRVAQSVAGALAYAHRHGIAHGGLLPENVLVERQSGRVVLTDFGVSRVLARARGPGAVPADRAGFLAPEQADGSPPDERSDIFGLGALLFYLLTGERPAPGMVSTPAGMPRLRSLCPRLPLWVETLVARCMAPDPQDRFSSAAEVAAELQAQAASLAQAEPPPAAGPSGQAPVLHENVQFTVYRPKTMQPERWYPLLAFCHLSERPPDAGPDEPDPVEEVQRQAAALLKGQSYQSLTQDSQAAVPEQGELTLIPEMEGVAFNPPRRTFCFEESVHREEFRMRAPASAEGRTLRGRLTVLLGALVLADVPLSVKVQATASLDAPEMAPASARPYRKIFASYSHRDLPIVQQVETFVETLGDRFLRDWRELRAGEVWDDRLLAMIREADVFQLFWSWNSMRSPFVRREWEYALALGRPNFVRPTYWEEPMPFLPQEDLPPAELQRLHFTRLGPAVTEAAAATAQVGAPAPAVARAPMRPMAPAEAAVGAPASPVPPLPAMAPASSPRVAPAEKGGGAAAAGICGVLAALVALLLAGMLWG